MQAKGRLFVDRLTGRLVALGGAAVLGAIALIFLFLLWVVLPIFAPAGVDRLGSRELDIGRPIAAALNNAFDEAAVFTESGELVFVDLPGLGRPAADVHRVPLTDGPVKAVVAVYPTEDTFALLTAEEEIRFYRVVHERGSAGPPGAGRAEPLFDALPLPLNRCRIDAIRHFDAIRDGERLRVAILAESGATCLLEFTAAWDGYPLEVSAVARLEAAGTAATLAFGPGGRWLYRFAATGEYRLTDIAFLDRPAPHGTGRLVAEDSRPLALELLLGRYSVLVSDEKGTVTQWSLQRQGAITELAPIRQFQFPGPIAGMRSEPRRKGFVAFGRDNSAYLAHTTAHEILTSFRLTPSPSPPLAAFTPNADALVLVGADRLSAFAIHNDHPEISWSTLWRRIWYEGYDEPVYNWQSSSADTDFEPKFSLTPLFFGTLKAAFYALLFAIPLAVMGAVYTACFMSPAMRRWVKPGIEVMASLPTVVLGFLAGLWLAPLVENTLTAVLLSILALPLAMLAFAFAWRLLPDRLARHFEGWFALIAVPVLLLTGYTVFALDGQLEALLFDGNARAWVQGNLGLDYDQRNALVVGMAMGLAVIPVIFSVSEQAIHGVPAHLVRGSLALGATRWQTVMRVILLTASPGIVSAVMIGLGRAAGETMIVLMASGNTPILDLNLFQGLRTFAANIAVELPEAEVDSSHYRILFLIALLLFLMTFAINTAAELVRERLRTRYGKL